MKRSAGTELEKRPVPAIALAIGIVWAISSCVGSAPSKGPGGAAGDERYMPGGVELVREDFESRTDAWMGQVLEEPDGNRFMRTVPGLGAFGPFDAYELFPGVRDFRLRFSYRKNELSAGDESRSMEVSLRRSRDWSSRLELSVSGSSARLVLRASSGDVSLETKVLPLRARPYDWTSYEVTCVDRLLTLAAGGYRLEWTLPEATEGYINFTGPESVDLDNVELSILDAGPAGARRSSDGTWYLDALAPFESAAGLLPAGLWEHNGTELAKGQAVDFSKLNSEGDSLVNSLLPAVGDFTFEVAFALSDSWKAQPFVGMGQSIPGSGWRMRLTQERAYVTHGDGYWSRGLVDERTDVSKRGGGRIVLGVVRSGADAWFTVNGEAVFALPGARNLDGRLCFGLSQPYGTMALASVRLSREAAVPSGVRARVDPAGSDAGPYPPPLQQIVSFKGFTSWCNESSTVSLKQTGEGGEAVLAFSLSSRSDGDGSRHTVMGTDVRADLSAYGGIEIIARSETIPRAHLQLFTRIGKDAWAASTAYFTLEPSWRRIFLPFGQEAFTSEAGFDPRRVESGELGLFNESGDVDGTIFVKAIKLVPKALAASASRELVLADFEEGGESRFFLPSRSSLDVMDGSSAEAGFYTDPESGRRAFAVSARNDKPGYLFWQHWYGNADAGGKDGITFRIRSDGFTQATLGMATFGGQQRQDSNTWQIYPLAVPLSGRWVSWRLPFAPGALTGECNGLSTSMRPNPRAIGELFMARAWAEAPAEGAMYLDEMSAYTAGVRADALRVGLAQPRDGGGASSYLRTVADTMALNLAGSPGLDVVMLGDGDPQAAAERESCSYYLVPECSVSAGKLSIKASFRRTLGSEPPQSIQRSSPIGTDLFESIDQIVARMVSSFVGGNASFDAMLERGDEGARFSDPLERSGEHWLAFGAAKSPGGAAGFAVSDGGMFLLEPYQEGASELSAALTIQSGSAFLYWDYLGELVFHRLEIDLAAQELRLRRPWSVERAQLPPGSLVKGAAVSVRVVLGSDASEVYLDGKRVASFLPSRRPLGRAGFAASKGGSSSFRNYSALCLEDAGADGRLGGQGPSAAGKEVPLVRPVSVPDPLASSFRLAAPEAKPVALSLSDGFSPKPDGRWRFGREVWTETIRGGQVLTLNPARGLARASFGWLLGDLELSGTIAIPSWSGDDQWAGVQWAVPEADGSALVQGGYFFTLRPDGAVALYKGPLSLRPTPVVSANVAFDPARGIDFAVSRKGSLMTVSLDGKPVLALDDDTYACGFAGFLAYANDSEKAAFDDVRLKASSWPMADPGIARGAPAQAMAAGQTESHGSAESAFSLAYVPAAGTFTAVDDSQYGLQASPLLLGTTEIPYRLWKAVRDWATDPARGPAVYSIAARGQGGGQGDGVPATGADAALHPVTMVSWRDAVVWCNALTEYLNAVEGAAYLPAYYADPLYARPLRTSRQGDAKEPEPGSADNPYVLAEFPGNTAITNCAADGFRLPSSLEWSVAARWIRDANGDGDILDAGEFTPGSWASGAKGPVGDAGETSRVAVVPGGAGAGNPSSTRATGSRAPNALGLFDMSGNVWEWCHDGDPFASRPYRVSRGGSWYGDRASLSVGYVNAPTLRYANSWVGFRVARTPARALYAPPPGTNLVANGNFERPGFWYVWFDPAASEGTSSLSGGEAYVDVKRGGYVTLGYTGAFRLEKGVRYELTFTYSGPEGHLVTADINEMGKDSDADGDIWSLYQRTEVVCSPAPRQHRYTFIADRSNDWLRVVFAVGGADGVWARIDDVALRVSPK